jgi:hypothetical protein
MNIKLTSELTTGWWFRCSYHTGGKRLFSSPKHPRPAVGPHSLLFNGYRDCSPGVKRSECEVNCSRPSSAEVQNEWGPTSHGADRDNFYSDLSV